MKSPRFSTVRIYHFEQRLWTLTILLTLQLLIPLAVSAQEQTRRVLIITGYDPGYPAVSLLNQNITSTIRNGSTGRVEFFYEFQENFRIPNSKYETEMVTYLRRKYEGENINLVLTLGAPALTFLLKHESVLFPGIPKVYYFHDETEQTAHALWPRVTGVWANLETDKTLQMALALQPDTENVFIVSGNSNQDRYLREETQRHVRTYEARLNFTYLTDLTIEELQQKVAALPPKSIVLYLSYFVDKRGNAYSGPEALSRIAPTANVPIFGIAETYVGAGIVGGSLLDFQGLGKRTGEVAVEIMNGANTRDITPQTAPNIALADWRELRRWNLDENKLPPGTVVRFKQQSFWELYKWYVIAVIATLLLQAASIAWLLFTRARRREAERESARLAVVAASEHRRLNDVLSNVPGVVWESSITPANGERQTTFVSDYVEKMLGYSAKEWLPTPGFGLNLVHEEDRERVKREVERVINSKSEDVVQFRWIAKDGHVVWAETHLAPMVNQAGEVVKVLGVTLDITQQKFAEERFIKAFRANPQPMSLTTVPDGLYIDVNESFLAMSGYTRDEVVGHTSIELNVWEAAADREAFFDELNKRESVINYEMRFRRKDGSFRSLLLSTENLEIYGKPCLLTASSDITEFLQAQQAVRESEARFRNMADTAPVMIWISDQSKGCTYFNKQWLDFTGRSLEEESGFGWAQGVHPEDYDRCLETYNCSFDQQHKFEMEYRLRRRDGEYRWVLDSGTPRFSSDGSFLGYIGSSIDITERKSAEVAMHKAHEELNRLKNQLEAENIYLQEELQLDQTFGDIVGQSDAIKYVLFKVTQVAPTNSTVLITGETGTGKELVARAIHDASSRKDRSLIKVNCAALSSSLIESELFGHEKGAFTGASGRKLGRFELADGGTIFLDEIGELPPELQVKLLRVIQEGEFERVGGTKTIKADVRIIAASNRDLKAQVEKGAFREDLWYRLNVFPITVPRLRQRKGDIPALAEHFIAKFARRSGKTITSVSPRVMQALQAHSWPGNVRELANVIERAVIHTQGDVLQSVGTLEHTTEEPDASLKTLEEVERECIMRTLEGTGWRIEGQYGAAKILGLNPSTLRTRMLKLGIKRRSANVTL